MGSQGLFRDLGVVFVWLAAGTTCTSKIRAAPRVGDQIMLHSSNPTLEWPLPHCCISQHRLFAPERLRCTLQGPPACKAQNCGNIPCLHALESIKHVQIVCANTYQEVVSVPNIEVCEIRCRVEFGGECRQSPSVASQPITPVNTCRSGETAVPVRGCQLAPAARAR
jgi:hypothetical protein